MARARRRPPQGRRGALERGRRRRGGELLSPAVAGRRGALAARRLAAAHPPRAAAGGRDGGNKPPYLLSSGGSSGSVSESDDTQHSRSATHEGSYPLPPVPPPLTPHQINVAVPPSYPPAHADALRWMVAKEQQATGAYYAHPGGGGGHLAPHHPPSGYPTRPPLHYPPPDTPTSAGDPEAPPLAGFLWKRHSSWRAFAYHRRFFYLSDDALCYTTRPAPTEDPHRRAGEDDAPNGAVVVGAGREKRIALSSITCVRMHSKLKYEFEVVCSHRSYRLRAPSAQALALWVTHLSSEWLALRDPPTHLLRAARAVSTPAVAFSSMPPQPPIGPARAQSQPNEIG